MRQLITEFPNQMRDAWKVVENSPIDLEGFIPKGALILGMGGSGISGVIASRMLAATSPVLQSRPIQTIRFRVGWALTHW